MTREKIQKMQNILGILCLFIGFCIFAIVSLWANGFLKEHIFILLLIFLGAFVLTDLARIYLNCMIDVFSVRKVQ